MNGQILCIGGSESRWRSWGQSLEDNGYVVVHAINEQEARVLLQACPVDVVCIDSQLMTEVGSSEIGAELKNTRPHVPVVLVQTGNGMPPHFEEHVDVVIDESTFRSAGHWLIEELREVKFPVFVEWLESWKQRSPNDEKDAAQVC
jgi:DNA-binding NtrC family response regulator